MIWALIAFWLLGAALDARREVLGILGVWREGEMRLSGKKWLVFKTPRWRWWLVWHIVAKVVASLLIGWVTLPGQIIAAVGGLLMWIGGWSERLYIIVRISGILVHYKSLETPSEDPEDA